MGLLHQAAYRGELRNVQWLIDEGLVSVMGTDVRGETALHTAASRGLSEVVLLLISKHANVNASGRAGWAPLHYAALCREQSGVVKLLLENGADVDKKCKNLMTPLNISCFSGTSESTIECLIKHGGADVQSVDIYGSTPLHRAAEAGHLHVIRQLCAYDVDINARDRCGWTPLHKASFDGHAGAVDELVAIGVDISCRVKDGLHRSKTAAELARTRGHDHIAESLETECILRSVSVCMGRHARLGELSMLSRLDLELIRKILEDSTRDVTPLP